MPPDLLTLKELGVQPAQYFAEVSPGVHAYVYVQAMSRVRAYQSAALRPHASRGPPQETLLVGHIHVNGEGKVESVEGFNGREGEHFVQRAKAALEKLGLLASEARVTAIMPLRNCPVAARGLR
ncbi:MAG: hypothetical protein ACYDCK_11655 [Thermoplasmatota archaeon]